MFAGFRIPLGDGLEFLTVPVSFLLSVLFLIIITKKSHFGHAEHGRVSLYWTLCAKSKKNPASAVFRYNYKPLTCKV